MKLEFRTWFEGGFGTDEKATVQMGLGVRGAGTIGPSRKKNPPDGVRTPTTNAPLALRDQGKGVMPGQQPTPMSQQPMQPTQRMR